MLNETLVNAVRNASAVVSILIGMVILDPLLTAISLALLPVTIFLSTRVGAANREVNAQRQERLSSMVSQMQETLSVSGAMLVKVFGRENATRRQFEEESQSVADLGVRRQMIGAWLMSASMTVFAVAPVSVYGIAGYDIITSETPDITIGTVIAFTALQGRLVGPWGPVTQLLNMRVQIQGSLALFERIFAYLDMPVTIADKANAARLHSDQVRGRIHFDHVSFTYQPDQQPASEAGDVEGAQSDSVAGPVLHDITATVEPGQLVALVGPSGAGKSTLVSLVPRLYDVDSGSVGIDGVDVRELALESLGEIIGVVTQETYLFHATVGENL